MTYETSRHLAYESTGFRLQTTEPSAETAPHAQTASPAEMIHPQKL